MNTNAGLKPSINYIVLIIVALSLWYFFFGGGKLLSEAFGQDMTMEESAKASDWASDVTILQGYLTTYITDTYIYLRAKYADILKSKGLAYEPAVGDAALADPSLVPARTQIRAWIDSWTLLMKNKYGDNVFETNNAARGFTYTQRPDGPIVVHYNNFGKGAHLLV